MSISATMLVKLLNSERSISLSKRIFLTKAKKRVFVYLNHQKCSQCLRNAQQHSLISESLLFCLQTEKSQKFYRFESVQNFS